MATEGGSVGRLAYSVDEAAEALGVSRDTVQDLIRRAELHSVKLGHRRVIPRAALEALLSRPSHGPGEWLAPAQYRRRDGLGQPALEAGPVELHSGDRLAEALELLAAVLGQALEQLAGHQGAAPVEAASSPRR